jgi:hypothetical protein
VGEAVENFELMAGHKCEALTKRCWFGFAKLFTFCSGGKRSIQTELRALFIDRSIAESLPPKPVAPEVMCELMYSD